MLWLIGYGEERTFHYTSARLAELGVAFSVADLDRLTSGGRAYWRLTQDHLECGWGGEHFRISRGDVVFQRAYHRELATLPERTYLAEFLEALAVFARRICVVNPPDTATENGLKLLHLDSLRRAGFRIPETIAGTSPQSVASLVSPDGNWISKGCSGVRTRVEALEKEDFGQLGCIASVPSQFQRRVGEYDVRVHMIDSCAVGLQIRTDAVDYRYATSEDKQVEYSSVDVPASIRVRCTEYMNKTGLVFAGFDFRVDSAGWTVLECNPMPGYDFYDSRASGAVSRRLAEFLVARERREDTGDGSVELSLPLEQRLFIGRSRRPRTNHS